MKTNRFALILTLINLIVLLFIAAMPQQQEFEKITVKEFELVDKNGNQRASIVTGQSGEVVLRLKDAQGTIRVKLGAGADGSGLLLLDDTTNPGVHALAKKNGSGITIISKDGKKKEY